MNLAIALALMLADIVFAKPIGGNEHLLSSYLSDAKISESTADTYRSYKIYLHLYENHRDFFYQNALRPYISLTRELGSAERLIRVCNVLQTNSKYADEVHYQCGFELFAIGQHAEAKKHLTKITKKSKAHVKAKILLASNYLANEDFNSCIQTLDEVKGEDYQKKSLADLYFLTKARCQAKGKAYNKAIISYQSISSTSRYYFDSLTELAWVFFKIRDVDLVKNTAKVIQVSHKKGSVNDHKVASIGQYFMARYLVSYLDLVVYGNTSKERFSAISNEVDDYLKNEFTKKEDLRSAIGAIEKARSFSELKAKSKAYKDFIFHISQWLPFESIQKFEADVRLLIALSREQDRFKKKIYTDTKTSQRAIAALYEKIDQSIKTNLVSLYDTAFRVVNGFKLKLQIGQVDLKNLSQTEGLKSLDEATTIYKEKENSLAQKLGRGI